MELANKVLPDNSNNNVSQVNVTDLSQVNVTDLSQVNVADLSRTAVQQTRNADQQTNSSDLQVRSVESVVTINPIVSKIVTELTNDPKFLARIDESVKKMLEDGKLDSTDIPEIVYLIMDAYNTMGSVRVSKEDLGSFVKLIFQFLVDKYKLLPSDKLPEYESMLMSSVKLVLLTPQVDTFVKNVSDRLRKYLICW